MGFLNFGFFGGGGGGGFAVYLFVFVPSASGTRAARRLVRDVAPLHPRPDFLFPARRSPRRPATTASMRDEGRSLAHSNSLSLSSHLLDSSGEHALSRSCWLLLLYQLSSTQFALSNDLQNNSIPIYAFRLSVVVVVFASLQQGAITPNKRTRTWEKENHKVARNVLPRRRILLGFVILIQ